MIKCLDKLRDEFSKTLTYNFYLNKRLQCFAFFLWRLIWNHTQEARDSSGKNWGNFSLRDYNDTTIHFPYIIDIIMEDKLKISQERKICNESRYWLISYEVYAPKTSFVDTFYKTVAQMSWLDIRTASEWESWEAASPHTGVISICKVSARGSQISRVSFINLWLC